MLDIFNMIETHSCSNQYQECEKALRIAMRVDSANSVSWIEQIEKTGLITRLPQLLNPLVTFAAQSREWFAS
jgi:hypothetical protein